MSEKPVGAIVVRGARQNNLKNLSLEIPTHSLVVVTGVSGSGKSSLVFDTLYAEGQRRYVETFSPYARQFLDRMDKPQVDRIEGIPPAIAIDQTNPVRTSRSTVGTMTELTDHLKLLFARGAHLYCRDCGEHVRRDTADSIYQDVAKRVAEIGDTQPRLTIAFPVVVPKNFTEAEVRGLLEKQGYTRVRTLENRTLEVIQDRFVLANVERARVIDALESALRVGRGRVTVYAGDPHPNSPYSSTWRYSSDLHCPDCDIDYRDPVPSLFSFNSPLGACESCRGFGRTIGIDYGFVIPDETKTLAQGAIKTWQSESYKECQDDLVKYAKKRGIRLDVPWRELTGAEREWVIEGEGGWDKKVWYGTKRFFAWLETKSYKMHIRVLLSKYRSYTECAACAGARLKPEALGWRLGTKTDADAVLPEISRYRPTQSKWSDDVLRSRPGLCLHDLALLPIERLHQFFIRLTLPPPFDEASDLVLKEIRARLSYLLDVGLGYLTLDRQSRTLSGGEVQRINLTTALGTSLVNTLFVLDEPSIGLHPRDMGRVIDVMQRLKQAGNSLVVVEHDPQIMLAADRLLDIGPGPGERGGEVVFYGAPAELAHARESLTADYLLGRKEVAVAPTLTLPRGAGEGTSASRRAGKGTSSAVRDSDPQSRAYSLEPRIAAKAAIRLLGAAEHNLKNVDLELPLNAFVCITGVSGSGKSTLIEDVLYRALLKHKGKPTESPGQYRSLKGADSVAEVVMVDQSPIGRTTRSNPASYVGVFDGIRKLFADSSAAQERGYTAGMFSFNAGDGRCPTCGGNGYEHVEMQFLSDVYLRCPDCNGKRFRPEVLEVKLAVDASEFNIADVLDMTVAEAARHFRSHREVIARLQPLVDVGLEYMKLGQPVPTMSGGEAQRLKLAGFLADARVGRDNRAASGGTLFLFDEPTTGLHFDDIAKLLRAFRQLIAAGNSVVVIEHNLDVMRAADWLIDLGPEGGDAGGEIVCVGTPQDVMACEHSHTGKALREYAVAVPTLIAPTLTLPRGAGEGTSDSDLQPRAHSPEPRIAANAAIRIHGAREHNLKNVDVELPRDKFTVVTGVSGSGKSTLAFDIVFGEGQRRYLESLNAYARQFVQPASKPDVDAIFGIPPTVAIEQRTSRGGRKSTVATLTEIYHFLRLLYVKLGTQYCPDCNVAIEPQSFDAIAARILKDYRKETVTLLSPLVTHRKGIYNDLAKWAAGKGYAQLRVDGKLLPTNKWPKLDRFKEHTIELPVATLEISASRERELREALHLALEYGKGILQVLSGNFPLPALPRKRGRGASEPSTVNRQRSTAPRVFSTRRACPSCGTSFAELDPRLFSFNSKHGWCDDCFGTGLQLSGFDEAQSGEEIWWNEWFEGSASACATCAGQRLNAVARNVRFRELSIAELTTKSVDELAHWLLGVKLQGREAEIARDIVAEIKSRLEFLTDVGLGYLSLDRSAPSLSGGEAQRIRLAAQLGSNLQGVCYILDEPTIGLHPRDNQILLRTLEKLGRKGNTLLVVEHDEETIRRADHVIDLGPGAGTRGGRIVAQGSASELMRSAESTTGRFLAQPLRHPVDARRGVGSNHPVLTVKAASLHNLHGIDARIPLGRLVVVTGVSGSGKSTLARDVLHDNLRARLSASPRSQKFSWNGCKSIEGWEQVTRLLEVDQTPIGKTPRSCPATYVGFWDLIRQIYANTTEARLRGYAAGRFSFNTAGGRCEACEGQGLRKIEMSFLPDVKVMCDVCGGKRFAPETLAIEYKGKSIGDVLMMSVDDAVDFFTAHEKIHRALRLLQDVGLGYLTLGQQSPTLSGGEAQRIKLVTELAKVKEGGVGVGPWALDRKKAARSDKPSLAKAQSPIPNGPSGTLYILDEPTVGLHMADIEKLIHVLHRLVSAGNTVVVVEHDLDIMAEADWIIDLGPEGGAGGGKIVAQGPPEVVMKKSSHTARVLRKFLEERNSVHRS